ncbi:hypothetical protein [Nocardioides sp. SYSU D00065]|uniref:hypothetical protein n=1 Tax=Nocardioides sp. SYSU D00065 TaxID=2817378 RepID=UPI001B336FFF|nr:hypothetical protein [Nocardioides sp. SYSU D00065]
MTALEPTGNVVRPTVWQENAARSATRDRVAHVDMVLDAACKAAVRSFREGRPGYALFQLARAEQRAARVLGPTDWSTLAGGAR